MQWRGLQARAVRVTGKMPAAYRRNYAPFLNAVSAVLASTPTFCFQVLIAIDQSQVGFFDGGIERLVLGRGGLLGRDVIAQALLIGVGCFRRSR